MRPMTHPAMDQVSLESVLYALSDPARLGIVRSLSGDCAKTCSQAGCPSLPKSTLSHHFRILREAGLVLSEREGVSMKNTLRRDELEMRFPGLLETILKQAPGA